ncbi:hypothetical protein [Dyella sp. C9]|uniref:hypothetical protein n=1 Tax=Dyella sp. C9 TaxID=2202154 RepID=UPI000DEF6A7B|nr:hypothetical protein [Dyella sp. C9]
MARTADYTIQGFLYQFNKTLLEILRAAGDSVVTVEGIVEDIEIVAGDVTTAIQCKYHESNDAFTLSSIYKPLLQMMEHFHVRSGGKVNYLLYAHFPGLAPDGIKVTEAELKTALGSQNKDYQKYIEAVKGISLDKFLQKFSAEVGLSYDDLAKEVANELVAAGFDRGEIETLVYPNAIQTIASLSILHQEQQRKVTKNQLLADLRQIRVTAITHWTLALKSRHAILAARRKQLKSNLSKNVRSRYFLLHADAIDGFDDQAVLLVSDYLDKYHFKASHTRTPVFCINTDPDRFRSIHNRLMQKDIVANTGVEGDVFREERFIREPLVQKKDGGIRREFSIRLMRFGENNGVLNNKKGDDLFVLGDGGHDGLDVKDVNVEELGTASIAEIKYLIGLSDVYE